jgi:predicted RND superfamily exporter protein
MIEKKNNFMKKYKTDKSNKSGEKAILLSVEKYEMNNRYLSRLKEYTEYIPSIGI